MLAALIVIPIVFGILCLVLPSSPLRRAALIAGSLTHLGVVIRSWRTEGLTEPWAPIRITDVMGIDPLGHLMITFISVLFSATSIYFLAYHRKALVSQRVFLACMLGLLAALSTVCVSQHLGLLWVAMEAASLATIPLIYFRLGAPALEATWKFVLMNSVGIALALLGIFSIALSTTGHHPIVTLTVSDLTQHAGSFDPAWLRAGFLLALIGFGTKMGLAPLHSWKPDAYGEAPPPVVALLAGGMTLGAFVGILRVFQVCSAAGMALFAGSWLIVFGLLSVATAAVFIVGNGDYRRLLAYTSVEHMGILVIGIGLGATGSYASMLHAMHNTLNKGDSFFLAGILWRLHETNQIRDVRGTLIRHPVTGILLLAALCATCGLPPFGMFFSELGIVLAAAEQGRWWVLGLFVLTLSVVFVGVMTAMLPMVFGEPSESISPDRTEHPLERWRYVTMLGVTAVLLLLALSLGSYQPSSVHDALARAAAVLYQPASGSVALASSMEVHP